MQPIAATLHPLTLGPPSPAAPSARDSEAIVSAHTERFDPEPHRASLTRFARCVLGGEAEAEDAVQETLLAALRTHRAFAGRSSMRTWLHGILKHKIADALRRQAREVHLDDDSDDDAIDRLFTADGHWRRPPSLAQDPEASLSQRQFLDALEACIGSLPRNTARVFTLREVMGLDIAEICRTLGISQNHCSVMLFRARLKLRSMLEQHWAATADRA